MDPLIRLMMRQRLVFPPLLLTGDPDRTLSRSSSLSGSSSRDLGHGIPSVDDGVLALEAELLQLGYLVSAPLRTRLSALTADELAVAGRTLIDALLTKVGGHVEHVPLFRRFPHSVPADTATFFVRRVFSVLLQEPDQPCVLCGRVSTVRPVSPCGHLVCPTCWDGTDFSACPICLHRLDPDDPFVRPTDVGRASATRQARDAVPRRFVLLGLCDDLTAWVRDELARLLSGQAAPRAEDLAAITALVERSWPESAEWLPARIPARETRALVLAHAVRHGRLDLLSRHIDSATDVLRLLYVLMGGDPGLRSRPRRRGSLPRPVRRALIAELDRLSVPSLVEDMRRYGEAWKHLAEVLHPYEFCRRYPDAALAFAVLRRTAVEKGTPLGDTLLARAAAYPDALELFDGRIRGRGFAGLVEAALRDDPARALTLLARRPGELIRRTADLARRVPEDDLAAAVAAAAPRTAPGVLLATLGQVRTPPGGTRVFLVRGTSARVWVGPDNRQAIPESTVTMLGSVLTGELLRRAAALPPIDRALLDEELGDLLVPTAERSASSALVRLSRGSLRPLPNGEHIRLFLHWAEPKGREVDLDLSVVLFSDSWQFLGQCDYTNLRFMENLAVHSGDLTSAPEPRGASEFVDLDVAELRAARVRYVVPLVFSFNDVPFEELVRGFAGLMDTPARVFDPLAVQQRFDLAGPAKVLLPLVMDLWQRTMRWADLNLPDFGDYHDVHEYQVQIARLAAAVQNAYGLDTQVSLWEVAGWHAAARAQEIVVRHRSGRVTYYRRGPGEDPAEFAARLGVRPDGLLAEGEWDAKPADFAAVIRDDVPVRPGAQVYALHPERLDPATITALDATSLVSALAPADAAVPQG